VKPSTKRSYEQLLGLHVTPHFGDRKLTEITREQVKRFLAELSQATQVISKITGPKFSKNSSEPNLSSCATPSCFLR
jgi:hypothetical protein